MGTISYQAKSGTWSGDIILNYTAQYDRENNQTRITFSNCRVEYSSAVGYESKTTTTITVKDQSGGKQTITLGTFLASSDAGGGHKSFVAEPNPASVIVDHPGGPGQKTAEISAYTEFSLVAYAGEDRMNIKSDTASAALTTATMYTLTKSAGAGSVITVDNTTSGKTGLASGALVAAGDKLKIRISARTGYALKTHKVNGQPVSPDTDISHTVSGNVSVTATAALKSYELTVVTDGKAMAAVKRGAETLKSGDTVSHFDVLSVTVSAKSGYKVSTAEINGTAISPDTAVSHTVSGPVGILAAAEPLSNLFVDDGGTRRRALLYIDDNGTRALYRAVFK